MARSLEVVVSDGIAFAYGGDTAVIVHSAPARLQRIRWLFDRLDELAAKAGSVNALMIVLPSSDPPDGPTRAENSIRLSQLRGKIRRIVTVVLGDSIRVSLVRSIMRAMFLIQGQAKVQRIAGSLNEGLVTLFIDPTPHMPERAQIEATLQEISKQLECTFN